MMSKQNKKNNSHGFFSNLKFMMSEQWHFEKKGVFIPFLRIPADIAVSLMAIWLPKIVLDAIDAALPAYKFVLQVSLLSLAMILLQYMDYYAEQSTLKSAAKIWMLHFMKKYFWKIVDMDYSNYASPNGKTAIKKAHNVLYKNAVLNLTSFYLNLVEVLKNVFGFVSYCAVIILLNPVIILILILSYAADGIAVLLIEKWIHKSKDARAKIDRKLDYVVRRTSYNSISKDIRLYNMKNWINTMAGFVMKEKLAWEKEISAINFLRSIFESFLVFIVNGGAYIYLIWEMLHSDMSIGDFALYFGAITGFGRWLGGIVYRVDQLSSSCYQVDDYRNLVETPDKMKRTAGAKLPGKHEPVEIVLENISFSYEDSKRVILKDINLTIKKGEKLAVVGANGVGKTTLIKLICGLLEPVKGRILLNGTNVREFNRDEYYTLITAVFQNVCLLPASIAQNITFRIGGNIDMERLKKCVELANLKEKLQSLPKGFETNLLPLVTGDGVELSGGEKQKLMLARALYKDAPLIILDEPTAALDPIAENEMYLKYNELTENKTAIYISHRLSSTRFCDRIIFIEDGKITETGSHDELIALGGKYKEMFDIQSKYYKREEMGCYSAW